MQGCFTSVCMSEVICNVAQVNNSSAHPPPIRAFLFSSPNLGMKDATGPPPRMPVPHRKEGMSQTCRFQDAQRLRGWDNTWLDIINDQQSGTCVAVEEKKKKSEWRKRLRLWLNKTMTANSYGWCSWIKRRQNASPGHASEKAWAFQRVKKERTTPPQQTDLSVTTRNTTLLQLFSSELCQVQKRVFNSHFDIQRFKLRWQIHNIWGQSFLVVLFLARLHNNEHTNPYRSSPSLSG